MYDVVLSDPPWKYYGSPTKYAAAGKHYPCLSTEELVKVAYPPLTSRGILFLWATSAKLSDALWLMSQWGLHYRGVAFVWVKTRKDGAVIGAQGPRPSIVKPTTEFVIVGSKVRRGRPMPLGSEKEPQVVMAPRREHSRKPEEVQDRIENLYPDATRLEMFARTHRLGWDAWGNETTKWTMANV